MTEVAPEAAVDEALHHIGERVTLQEVSVTSHTSLVASGLDEPGVIEALGLYMVALLAGMVRTSLRLGAALLELTPDGRAQLRADVEARLTPRAASPRTQEEFNEDVRDPWITECIGHAVLAVRKRTVTPCLRGPVAAMMVPHVNPSEQGLDLFAIFDDDGLPAMALGEAKATQRSGGERLTEATALFARVASGKRDVDIRQQVTVLADSLSDELQAGLSGAFWNERACYLPVIAYGNELNVARRRPALASIPRPSEEKRVLLCRPADYVRFFEAVAQAMRRAVDTVVP